MVRSGDATLPLRIIFRDNMSEDHKQCRKCKEVKPLEQFYLVARGSVGRSSDCKACISVAKREWRASNLEKAKAIAKASFLRNKERRNQESRDYYNANRALVSAKAREWREENSDLVKVRKQKYRIAHDVKARATMKLYRARRPELNAMICATRRVKKKSATPAWANKAAIAAIYREAKRLTKETGVPHHVDHVYPIKHPLVCGLHVETNLQILRASENQRKSNSFQPVQEVHL